jgi:hypothetical protein
MNHTASPSKELMELFTLLHSHVTKIGHLTIEVLGNNQKTQKTLARTLCPTMALKPNVVQNISLT